MDNIRDAMGAVMGQPIGGWRIMVYGYLPEDADDEDAYLRKVNLEVSAAIEKVKTDLELRLPHMTIHVEAY